MIQKVSPVTGEELGEFEITTEQEVEAAVARAREATKVWKHTSVEERLEYMQRLKELLTDRGPEIAKTVSEDTGKPYIDSLMTELMPIPLFIDYYSKEAPKILGREKVRTPIVLPGKYSYVEHYPMGVIAVISPWNFPFQLSIIPVISALIAGNCVVLKPSEVTPLTGALLDLVLSEIGLPEGVCQVVQGDGSTGAALTRADVDKIFFTGSVATGRKVMAAAAEKPIPVELELGGKDAMIVCHDAPMERAVKAAVWGGLINCGQMCISVERIFVVESVYDTFMRKLTEEVNKIRVGAPEEEADIGPLTFPPQMKTVQRHVDDALDKGAKVIAGGHAMSEKGSQFYAPTIVTDVRPGMEIYDEETFGPVLPVIKVKDEDEAIRMANDHKFGLTGSVWTKDKKRGIELASRMECGQAMVNDVVLSVGNPVLPFGGVKQSGFGRYHGPDGLLTFTHKKAIMVDRAFLSTEPFWFPYEDKFEVMKGVYDSFLKGHLMRAVGKLLKLR